MYGMFRDASVFDQDLGWCVDNGVDAPVCFLEAVERPTPRCVGA